MSVSPEDRAEMDAERGYSEVGAREQRLRDWYALHEPGEKAGDFERRIDSLRVVKWQRDNPEKTAAKAKRYYLKGGKQKQLEYERRRRLELHRAKPPITCARCKARFCLIRPHKGLATRLCSVACSVGEQQSRARRRAGLKARRCSTCGREGHNRLTCIEERT